MNFEDLTNKIIINITDWIMKKENNRTYSYITIPCSYYKSENDIKKLGFIVKNRFNLDDNNNDIIESYYNDYFIFKFRNIYIIININSDLDYNNVEYKLIKVYDRKEALIYRYGC